MGDPDNLTTIGERIRYAREQKDLSQAELRHRLAAIGVELSRARLWNYENRPQTIPKPDLLIAIGRVTGYSPGWLYCGTGLMLSDQALDELMAELAQDANPEHFTRDLQLLAKIRALPDRTRTAILALVDGLQ